MLASLGCLLLTHARLALLLPPPSPPNSALVNAGVVVVVPAGDLGETINNWCPARYAAALTVTAMVDTDSMPGGFGYKCGSPDDTAATFFSNFVEVHGVGSHEDHVVAAPGACVKSTSGTDGTSIQSGTVVAMAHVAGAVALCIGNVKTGAGPCASLTPAQIVAKMVADAAANAVAGRGFRFDRAGNELGIVHYGDLIDVFAY